MQDQVQGLNSCGIQSVYLGSAQYDENAEASAFGPTTNECVIFVTPEWICKPSNQAKVQSLQKTKSLALIAIDEAHLVQEWASFRSAFSELKQLKHIFLDTNIMALSATATPEVQHEITQLLRNLIVQNDTVNRPNITLNLEELRPEKSVEPAIQFAVQAAEIAGSTSAIIYTDQILAQ